MQERENDTTETSLKSNIGYKKNYTRGSIAAFLSAVGFGSLPVFAVFAYQEGVKVLTLLSFRFFFTSIILAVYMIKNNIIFLPDKKEIKGLVLLGILYAAFNFSYFSAFELIPASMAALIFYAYPALVALFAFFLGEEDLNITRAAAILTAFLGIYFVYYDFTAVIVPLGLLAAAGSAVFYALYIMAGNNTLKTVDLRTAVFYTCFFSAAGFLTAGSLQGDLQFVLAPRAILLLVVITIISMFGLLSFLYGVKNTSPTIASVASMIEPVFTVFLSLLILAETFSPIQYAGGILVVSSSAYIVVKKA